MWTMIISPIGEKKITISTHSTKKIHMQKKKKTKKVNNFRKRMSKPNAHRQKEKKKTPCTNR